MLDNDFASEPRALLRRLATGDEGLIRTALAQSPISGNPTPAAVPALDRRTRLLVSLAALLVLDAPTESLRWASDLACASGVDEDAIAATLVAVGRVAGSAQIVAAAPRLALAIGLEPAVGRGAQ